MMGFFKRLFGRKRRRTPRADAPIRDIYPIQDIEMILSRNGKRSGKVLLDTGCSINLVSKEHAQRLGWQEPKSHPPSRIGTGHGGGDVLSLDEIKVRWYIPSSTKARYEESMFHVVKDNSNEVVIGSTTIRDLGIFEPGPVFVGSLTTHIPKVDAATLKQQTERAKRERAFAQEQQRRDEEQEKKDKAAKRKP